MTALLSLSLLSFLVGCSKNSSPAVTSKFVELSQNERSRLDKQRTVIAAEAKRRYGISSLSRTKTDLAVLQRLLDDKAFNKERTYELQCMGVVFGDVLASELPLRWVMVTDEFGTDPTLQLRDTTIQLNALTMIAKRVEEGVALIDITNLFAGSKKIVADMKAEFEKEKAQQK